MKENFGLRAYSWRTYCLCFIGQSVCCGLGDLEYWDLFLEAGTIKASRWGRISNTESFSGWRPYFGAPQPNVPSIDRMAVCAFIGVLINAMLLKLEAKHIPLVKCLPLVDILLNPPLIGLEGKTFLL
jgi:hypothetical protein